VTILRQELSLLVNHFETGAFHPYGQQAPVASAVRCNAEVPLFNFLATKESRAANRLTLVDIGAAGGLQPKWLRHRHRVRPVMFEPNPQEAERLRRSSPLFPNALVMEYGLAASAGAYTLNVAHWPGCTSLLSADPVVLAGYKIAPLYETVKQVRVECVRFDELHDAGSVPTPDVIKVDVEGYEHQVLSGFGDLLHGVLGIEAEAWLYPVFKGQKLLHDLVALLAPFHMFLRRIEPVEGFEGDMVCVNAYFTRGKAGQPDLTTEQKPKFALLQRVWRIHDV
jgi:FkbM family methyltransferase